MTTTPTVRVLEAADLAPASRFAAHDPVTNAFIAGWLDTYGAAPQHVGLDFRFLASFDGAGISALALLAGGTACCLSTGADAGLAAIATTLDAGIARLRTIVGPRQAVAALLSGATLSVPIGRDVAQRLLRLGRDDLIYTSEPALRSAVADDVDTLTEASLRMLAEESGRTPSSRERDMFRRSTAFKVRSGWIWCLDEALRGRMVYKAARAAASPAAVQIEGVWTDPAWRGQGVGRRCTAELCYRLLAEWPQVVLYVDERNHAARAMYARVGFEERTGFRTIHVQ